MVTRQIAVLFTVFFLSLSALTPTAKADPPQLDPAAEKARNILYDPLIIVTYIAAEAWKHFFLGLGMRKAEWRDLLKKIKTDTKKLKEEVSKFAKENENRRNLERLYREKFIPLVDQALPKALQEEADALNEVEKHIVRLEEQLKIKIDPKDEEQVLDAQQKATKEWAKQYRALKKAEKASTQRLVDTFNQIMRYADQLTPPQNSYYNGRELKIEDGKLLYFDKLEQKEAERGLLMGVSQKMKGECSNYLADLAGKSKEAKKNLKENINSIRAEAASARPLRFIPAHFKGTAVALVAAVAGSAYTYSRFRPGPPPKPTLKDHMKKVESVQQVEPFMDVVASVLKKHQQDILKSLRDNLTDDEKEALNDGVLSLEGIVRVFDSPLPSDARRIKDAMRHAIETAGESQIRDDDKFEALLKNLDFHKYADLSKDEQEAYRRVIYPFLVEFYVQMFDVSLKGVSTRRANASIRKHIYDNLIKETIEELKKVNWKQPQRRKLFGGDPPKDSSATPVVKVDSAPLTSLGSIGK